MTQAPKFLSRKAAKTHRRRSFHFFIFAPSRLCVIIFYGGRVRTHFICLRLPWQRRGGVMTQGPKIFITQSREDTKKEIMPFLLLCAFAALRDNMIRLESQAKIRLNTLRSASTSAAQLWPGAPVTPPPGWLPAPHIYRPFNGPRYAAWPKIGRADHNWSRLILPCMMSPPTSPNVRSSPFGLRIWRPKTEARKPGA